MKWIASSLLIAIAALAIFAGTPSVSAGPPNLHTPTPAPSGTPISVGTTPVPTPTPHS